MATGGRYPSSKERVNYGRMCRIVVDLCTDVMRRILTKLVVPSQLLIEVQKCSDLKRLAADELHRINNAVVGTSYGKFDVSFLYKLIRAIGTQELRYDLDKRIPANSIRAKMQSIPSLMAQLTSKQHGVVQNPTDYAKFECGLLTLIIINLTSINIPNIIPSANDWGGKSPPKPTDVKLGDDIERIRLIRNTVYAHVSDTCVTDSEFQKYLTELTGVMQRMDQEFNTAGQYLKDLNDIESASLDDKWEMYESMIRELAKREQVIKDRLEIQEESTQHLQQDVDALNQNNKDATIRLEKHEETSVQLQKDVTVLHTSVKQMVSRLEKQEDTTGQLKTGAKQMENRLDKQEVSTGQLKSGVTQMVSRLEKQEHSTGQLKTGVKQMVSRLEKQEVSTGQLQTGVKQMESRLEKQEDSTGKLKTGVKQVVSRLEKQEVSTGQLQTGAKQMENRLEKQEVSTGQLQTGAKQMESRLEKQEVSTGQLQTGTKQMESRLEKQEVSTGQLQTGAKQMENRLEKQEVSTGQLQTGAKQMENRLEKQEVSTGKLQTGAKQMESRLEKQEVSTGQLHTGTKQMESRLEKQEVSTGQLQTGAKQMESRLEKQEVSTGQLQTGAKQMESRLEKQEVSTGQLQTGTKQMESRLEKQEVSTGQLQTGTKQMESRLEKQEVSTGQLKTGVKQMESRLEKQEESTGQLQTGVKQMESRVEKQEDSTGQLQTGTKQMESRLEKQEVSTGQLKTGVKQMESRLEKQEESTGQLQTDAKQMERRLEKQEDSTGQLQTQVASLSLPQEISPRKLEDWRKSDNTFYPTNATTHMSRAIKSKKKLVVCGLPGSGKTAAIHHIALKLKSEGYRLCSVQIFNEVKSNMDKFSEDEKQVYVIDDVFGVHGVDELKRKQWCEDNKDDLERCLNNPNISLLCSSRIQVLNDAQLKPIKSRFTIVNISEGAYELSKNEQAGIFRNHAITKERKNLLTENKDELKVDIKEKVREIECPVGCFPLVCHLYTGDKETKQTIEEYFNKPLNVIADHLEKLKVEDRLSHFCLLLCLIYDNKLQVNIITVGDESKQTKKLRKELLELCKLPVSTSREDIREKMDTLLQTFVKLEGDMYQFVHDIIHDAVIKHVSGMSSSLHKFIIRYCSSKFMRDRVHLSGVVCKDWLYPGHDTESCINIRPDSFICWGDRVLDIVRDGVRTSDQLYNDINEGRCSKDDYRVLFDDPWRDVFEYNGCVHSTEGQTAIVQALTGKSSDVQTIMCTKGYSGYGGHPRFTGLHWAIDRGITHIVTQTVSMLSPTQLREVESIHGGLLCYAIGNGCGIDVILALIVGGADANTPGVCGRTPLCLAIRNRCRCGTDVIQALIVGGADVNTPDVDGLTPLCLAIDGRYKIQALTDGGADVNTPHVDDRTPLWLAIHEGCGTDVIEALIVGGADVNTLDVRGYTPLCLAIDRGCGTDVIQALIVGGADVNTPDVYGDALLCLAIDRRCGTDVIQALIVGGVDVNTPDVDGRTPLCSAIDRGYSTDVIQALIVGGANVNTPDVLGYTPLHVSVALGDYKITQLLVDNGADVNQCDKGGSSALYQSQLRGHDTITELLESRGAVCMYKGKQYNHIADMPDLTLFDFVEYNNYQAVKILIERGVDINQCDKHGESVLYKSQLRGHNTITELLQSRGAVCIYKGKRYITITDIPDSEVDSDFEREMIQELKEKQNVTK